MLFWGVRLIKPAFLLDAIGRHPTAKPGLLSWLLFGRGPGPGEPSHKWVHDNMPAGVEKPKKAIKCDMCAGVDGGPACVSACPTGAAIRVAPEEFLTVSRVGAGG